MGGRGNYKHLETYSREKRSFISNPNITLESDVLVERDIST